MARINMALRTRSVICSPKDNAVRQMALQLGALREALLDAGASPEKADKAAEELASYENRLAGIETKLAVLVWMTGTNIAVTLGVLWLLLRVGAKVGALG